MTAAQASPGGLPLEKVRATRTEVRTRQLLESATRLMERAGFHGMSMQALADDAQVSVGLIYQYFPSKEDVLLAVIVDILDAYRAEVPPAIAAAGDDPVHRLAAGFRAFCEVNDRHRHGTVLAYRESKTLGPEGRERIKQLELATSEPLRQAVREGLARGVFLDVDPDVAAYDAALLAHAWALKHWHFGPAMTFDHYVAQQTALLLRSMLNPRRRSRYRHLLEVSP